MLDKSFHKLPKFGLAFAGLVVNSLFEALCILAQAYGLACGLNMLWEGASIEAAFPWIGLFGGAFIAVRVVLNMREAFASAYAARVVAGLRERLLGAVFRTGAPAVQAFGTGTTIAMLIDGTSKVKTYIELVVPKLANLAVLPLAFGLAIWMTDWVSGVVVTLLFPSMILLMVLIGKTTANRSRNQHERFKVMSNHFVDSVRGISTLETFAVSRSFSARIYEVSEHFREATMRTLKTATLSGSVLDLFTTLAIAAVSIMLGLRLIDGSLFLLPALFVLVLVPEFFRAVREYAADYHASLDGINSLRTIEGMLEACGSSEEADGFVASNTLGIQCGSIPSTHSTPSTLSFFSTPSTPSFSSTPSTHSSTQNLLQWTPSSCLLVQEISKTYDGVTALDDVSFEVHGTQRIGIIGKSGAGKSTLLRLIAGLEDPSTGSFSIGGNSHASSDVLFDSLRQRAWQDQIAYIPQEPYIFSATLRENLTFYNPEAADERIEEVIDELGLNSLVDALPEGLSTKIGEGGRAFSGGQAQRVALARVLLDEKRKVLLFDEPTAHLDIETEYELKQAMVKAMKGKLVLFATHRLHWLDSLDRAFVFDQGRLMETGRVDALLKYGNAINELVCALQGGDVA